MERSDKRLDYRDTLCIFDKQSTGFVGLEYKAITPHSRADAYKISVPLKNVWFTAVRIGCQ